MKTTCPSCDSRHLISLYQAKQVPAHQNLLYPTFEAAKRVTRGTLDLQVCTNCGFVFNCAFDPQLMNYSAQYDNSQTHSLAFRQYASDLASNLITTYNLHDKTIVEIGCGKGEFIHQLCQDGSNQGLGFDPAYEGPEIMLDGRLRYIREFFSTKYESIRADFYCSRHVIEHIPEPAEFLRSVRSAISHRNNVPLFLETPDVRWILEHGAFWDLFYEHCSLFSPGSLARLLTTCGFAVHIAQPVFGNQYMWVVSKSSDSPPTTLSTEVDTVSEMLLAVERFGERLDKTILKLREQILNLKEHGKRLAVWGAGAKGVTFLNVLDIHPDIIPVIVDVNPRKQGKYLPGTGQVIIAPSALQEYQPDVVLVMNPNYSDEIRVAINQMAVSCDLLIL